MRAAVQALCLPMPGWSSKTETRMSPELIYGIILMALPTVMSLTIHEFAHARTAQAFGDLTAKGMGRCTFNPLAHLDPIGTIGLLLGGFGWAKPVPVNSGNMHPQRLGDIAVSAAGPLSNLALAGLSAVVLRVLALKGVAVNVGEQYAPMDLAVFLLTFMVMINLNLFLFNLIPLFPLDGHHIGRETIGAAKRYGYMQWQMQYGRWVLLGLIIAPMFLRRTPLAGWDPLSLYMSYVMHPLTQWILGPDAWTLRWDVLAKFSHYLPWF